MKRDGACTSLWQDTVTDFILRQGEINNKVFDVVIVGGGITGITTGLQLQKGGKVCLIAEAHNICFGTTEGTTAHINTFFDTGSRFSYDGELLTGPARRGLDIIELSELVKEK